MKPSVFFLCTFITCPGLLAAAEAAGELEQAKTSTRQLALALKSELVAAMQTGGTSAAIEVCHRRARSIAAEVSARTGVQLSRVSLKNRNPENGATGWQQTVLERFEDRRRAGEPAAELNWQDRVETASGTEFRYMQAIATNGICLQCHGTDIAPQTAEILAELYPDDEAVGYREGDIRGAFVAISRQD